jgi:hypothetical protein
MALLDLLQKQGSVLSKLDGKSPKAGEKYEDSPTNTKLTGLLAKSSLDLDGVTPKTYREKVTPEAQGRI